MTTVESFEYKFNTAKKGSWHVYHAGDFADEIGSKPIGRYVRGLAERGRAILCQKKLVDDPRQYAYYAVKV